MRRWIKSQTFKHLESQKCHAHLLMDMFILHHFIIGVLLFLALSIPVLDIPLTIPNNIAHIPCSWCNPVVLRTQELSGLFERVDKNS